MKQTLFLIGMLLWLSTNAVLADNTTPPLLENLKVLAEQGVAEAQHNLGLRYENGRGVPQDYEEAVKWYRKAAEQGIAASQFNLGVSYENGRGVPQDFEEAVKWYRKAAERGVAAAQFTLGVRYDNGQGVPQDFHEAAKWYLKAAEQGVVNAQYNLGLKYLEGLYLPKDYVRAHMWFNLAAAGGSASAVKNREFAASQMTPEQITEAQRLAREWDKSYIHPPMLVPGLFGLPRGSGYIEEKAE